MHPNAHVIIGLDMHSKSLHVLSSVSRYPMGNMKTLIGLGLKNTEQRPISLLLLQLC